MRERARQSREQESAAPEFETAAPATMRMGEQSRVQNKAHTGHTPRGVNRQQRAERVRVREQNLHRAAAATHKHTHMHMLIVLKRGENEMQRNEWAAQNVRNKMEAGT